ncbi:8554_t:CDS:1 [Dentiscutata erythropus]|uniref:8554_t:CDS:1 n=1 Tax=Dentiscutata erythropus TaxID=1348616 RepID=A0A9N9CD03_9GLOM|nr:8554_t:CDS:1 [Dentiscutata erythropus]
MPEDELCCLSRIIVNLFSNKSKTFSKLRVPSLPTECMQQILQHIADQGVGSLYPFLLVNRYWCNNVIPFLWARPFEGQLPPENRYKFMLIYLASLTTQEKAALNASLRPYNITIPDLDPPLYNYPMFLEEFSYRNVETAVYSCICRWNTEEFVARNREEQILVLASTLCQLFMRNSKSLKTFIIDKFLNHSDLPDCSIFSSGQPGLRNISNLSIDCTKPMMENTIRLLELIPSLCKKIRCLDVKILFFENNTDIIQAIIKIIRAQESLIEFNLDGVRSGESSDIIQALQCQSLSITTIKFENVDFTADSLGLLAVCRQLRNLSLLYYRGLTMEGSTSTGEGGGSGSIWSHIKFDLRKLRLKNSTKSPLISAALIRAAGENLKCLSYDVITRETIDATIFYCPNITELELSDYLPHHNSLVYSLFRGLRQLKRLTISVYHNNANRYMIISGRELPTTLEYLKLQCGLTSIQLEDLLRDCMAPLKVLILDFIKFEHSDLKVITKFVKARRTLRYLGISGRIGWNVRETNELEALKRRGVKLIPWYEIDKW